MSNLLRNPNLAASVALLTATTLGLIAVEGCSSGTTSIGFVTAAKQAGPSHTIQRHMTVIIKLRSTLLRTMAINT